MTIREVNLALSLLYHSITSIRLHGNPMIAFRTQVAQDIPTIN